jgi:murein DD-endopeptidase MepM/ murein hydrolase activator NlpD
MRIELPLFLVLMGLVLTGHAADVGLHGTLTQGALLEGRVAPGNTVYLDGRKIRVSDEGVFVIGFGRDAPAVASLVVRDPNGAEESKQLKVRRRAFDIQRIDGLPQRKVTPKPEDLERIRADVAKVRTARELDDARVDFLSGWQWPVIGRVSGVYGSQRVLNGKPRRPHFGVDIAAPEGTLINAPADGVVTLLDDAMFYSGVTLLIDHGHGLTTAYLHMKRALVAPGDRVRRGQAIGEVGATGRATGPHLHWGLNWFETRLDPALLVGPMPERES